MFVFEYVTIQNFKSYGNNKTTIKLEVDEPVLIVGMNKDHGNNGESDSNGAGKSAIRNAIVFALYGKVMDKLSSVNSLINNVNKSDLYVELVFRDTTTNTRYMVKRFRKNKALGGNGVIFLKSVKGGEFTDESLSSDAETTKLIERVIGIPYEICVRILIFNYKSISFFDLPIQQRKDMLEEIFGYKELSEKATKLKDVIKELKAELATLIREQDIVNSQITQLEESYSQAEQAVKQFEDERKAAVSKLEAEIATIPAIDVDRAKEELKRFSDLVQKSDSLASQLTIISAEIRHLVEKKSLVEKQTSMMSGQRNAIMKKISSLEEKVSSFDENSFMEHLSLMEQDEATVQELQRRLSELVLRKQEIKREADSLAERYASLSNDNCPYCNQHMPDAHQRAEETKEQIVSLASENKAIMDSEAELNAELVKTSNRLQATKEDLSKFTFSNVSDYESAISELDALKMELEKIESATTEGIGEIESEIVEKERLKADLEKKVSDINAEIHSVRGGLEFTSESEIQEIVSRKASLEEKLDTLKAGSNPYLEQRNKMKELLEAAKKSDKSDEIRNSEDTLRHQELLLKLLTKKDSFLRQHILDMSLPQLNERLSYYLKTIGMPHTVSFDNDMGVSISIFGTDMEFDMLSTGQQARINLSLAFAFRDMLQYRFNFVNLCFLDECLDFGLSNIGVQRAVKMIKGIAKENDVNMFVVSHRDEVVSLFNKTMNVVLDNGFTSIVQ